MRQLRILHTESSLGWGGQEWRVYLELVWMKQHGHEVWLAAPKNSEIFRRCAKEGINTLEITFNRSALLAELVNLIRFFVQKKIQIVNTHSSRDGWLGGLAARLAHVPAIIRSRHIEVDYDSPFLARLSFEFLADHVLTTSTKISQRLIKELGLDPARINCQPTGVDLTRFYPGVTGTLHKELHLSPSTPLVGMVSVLRSWKGHEDFINAAKKILEQKPEAHFVIAGGGPGRDYVADLIQKADLEKKVTLLGYREDIPQILGSLSALVLPSTAHEGVPQIILQAQAMSVPVVGTNIGGIPDIVHNGETGLLVPPNNPVEIARAVLQLLNSPQESQRMTGNAFENVRSRHSMDAMGTKLEALYEQLLVAA